MANTVDMDCIVSGGDFVTGRVNAGYGESSLTISGDKIYSYIIMVSDSPEQIATNRKAIVYAYYGPNFHRIVFTGTTVGGPPYYYEDAQSGLSFNNNSISISKSNLDFYSHYNYIAWNDPT